MVTMCYNINGSKFLGEGGKIMTDIFACSMAKKSINVEGLKSDVDIFACSMAKKSSSDVVTLKSERVA